MSTAWPFWLGVLAWFLYPIFDPLANGTLVMLLTFLIALAVGAWVSGESTSDVKGASWGFLGYSTGMLVWLLLVMGGAMQPL